MEPRDRQDVRLLSIAFYILSLITFFAGTIFMIFFAAAYHRAAPELAKNPENLEALETFVPWMVMFGVHTLGWGIVQLLAGRFIQKRKHYRFCRAACVVTVLSIPLGTVLGIVSYRVLSRPGVRAMFPAAAG